MPPEESPTRPHHLAATACFALLAASCDPFGFAPAIEVCQILTDEGCPDGQTCIDVKEPQCTPAGKGTHGVGCIKDEDCAKLHLCVEGSNGARTCQRRCDITDPDSCAKAAEADGNDALKSAACLWVTPEGARDLGYCSSPQCSPASNEGCTDKQVCVGGIEPRCEDQGKSTTVSVGGEEVTFSYGEAALGELCKGPGHCVIGGVCAGVEADAGGTEQRCLNACTADSDGVKAKASERCGDKYTCVPLSFVPQGKKKAQDLPAGQGFCRLTHCNPVTNEGCKSAQKCIGASEPYCTAPGNAKLLDACDQLTDCDATTTCVNGGSKTLCVQKCDTTGKTAGKSCGSDQACYELKDAKGQPKPDNLGFCGPK